MQINIQGLLVDPSGNNLPSRDNVGTVIRREYLSERAWFDTY